MTGLHERVNRSMTPWPVHGGQLSELARLFPDAPTPWIDLSTGINPHAYPLARLDTALMQRLPDPLEENSLRVAAAEAYGVSSAHILAGAGTQMLIGLLPVFLSRFFKPSVIRILAPTYSGHEAAWREAGFAITSVPHGTALVPPDRQMVTVICSPNNPTGHRFSLAEIASLAEDHARFGGLLVVDEAFADFSLESAASLLPHPALLICRSFGKAYGLAGLRIGFLLGSHPVLHTMRAAIGPWAVSTPACHIGRDALSDRAWRQDMAPRLESEMAVLRRVVTQAGPDFVGGTSLFSLFRSCEAQTLWEKLARTGLLVRRFEWDETLLRFGLPPDEAVLRRIAQALS